MHTGFAVVLLAVAVGVVPDAVAKLGELVETGVNVGVVLASGQGDQSALTGRVDVAVGGFYAAEVLTGDDVAGGATTDTL
ncbi:MAG: hypothetical protein IPJ12_14710 [Betaproteobacteria bacterium]|nr:hypothetical protein [Betaproteobacteria bacterium]